MTETARDLDVRLMQELTNLQARHSLKAFKRHLESMVVLFKTELRVGKLAVKMSGKSMIQKKGIYFSVEINNTELTPLTARNT